MTKDEALHLALEELENCADLLKVFGAPIDSCVGATMLQAEVAITAIKQALAQPAPVEPDWKAEYLKSVESGCVTLDELREALAELEATNRQVEILSDALAESRREVAALKAVQEPWGYGRMSWGEKMFLPTLPSVRDGGWMALYTTPPAQPAPTVQDPVSGVVLRDGYPTLIQDKHIKETDKRLYTTPPAAQRQWVGLTDDEMYLNCPNWLSQEQCKVWTQQIEAKLKEKNI